MHSLTRLTFRAIRPLDQPPGAFDFKVGGMPYLLEPIDYPVCQQCGRAMAFIAQVPPQSPAATVSAVRHGLCVYVL
jgi:hypothetical protein